MAPPSAAGISAELGFNDDEAALLADDGEIPASAAPACSLRASALAVARAEAISELLCASCACRRSCPAPDSLPDACCLATASDRATEGKGQGKGSVQSGATEGKGRGKGQGSVTRFRVPGLPLRYSARGAEGRQAYEVQGSPDSELPSPPLANLRIASLKRTPLSPSPPLPLILEPFQLCPSPPLATHPCPPPLLPPSPSPATHP